VSEILQPVSDLSVRRLAAPAARPAITTVAAAVEAMSPRRYRAFGNRKVADFKRSNFEAIARSVADMAKFESGQLRALGQLWLTKVAGDGVRTDFGLVSCRVVTNAGVNYIVDAWQNLVELEDMRYHGVGTGTTAEAATQTALVTELTTQYSTSNSRPQGTLGEQSGVANAFESSATITVSAGVAITEHGLFSRAATGGGVLMDRSVFAAINLASGESLQATWRLTFPSGG